MSVSLPSSLGDMAWLEELAANPEVRQAFPLFIEAEDHIEVVAASILKEDSLTVHYFHLESSWRTYSSYDLREPSYVHDHDLLYPAASFVGIDAKVVRRLARGLGSKLEDLYMLGFVPYSQTDMGEIVKEYRGSCDCKPGSPKLGRLPTISEIEGELAIGCPHCMTTHGVVYKGRNVYLNTLFQDEWLFDDSSPDEIIEIEGDDDYGLYSSGKSVDKLEHTISTMSMIGGGVSSSFSKYNPEDHQGLVYVRAGEVAGYVTWEELDGLQILRQLFVQEEFRRQGIAKTLVETWCRKFCVDGDYYIDEPNEKSRSLFESIGHTNGDSNYEAIELFPLCGVGNDLDNIKMHPRS